MDLAQKVHVTMMLWTDGASSDAAVPLNLEAAYASLYSLSNLAEAAAARYEHVLRARFTHSRHVIPTCRETEKNCTSSNSLMVHLSLNNKMLFVGARTLKLHACRSSPAEPTQLSHLFMVHNSTSPLIFISS